MTKPCEIISGKYFPGEETAGTIANPTLLNNGSLEIATLVNRVARTFFTQESGTVSLQVTRNKLTLHNAGGTALGTLVFHTDKWVLDETTDMTAAQSQEITRLALEILHRVKAAASQNSASNSEGSSNPARAEASSVNHFNAGSGSGPAPVTVNNHIHCHCCHGKELDHTVNEPQQHDAPPPPAAASEPSPRRRGPPRKEGEDDAPRSSHPTVRAPHLVRGQFGDRTGLSQGEKQT